MPKKRLVLLLSFYMWTNMFIMFVFLSLLNWYTIQLFGTKVTEQDYHYLFMFHFLYKKSWKQKENETDAILFFLYLLKSDDNCNCVWWTSVLSAVLKIKKNDMRLRNKYYLNFFRNNSKFCRMQNIQGRKPKHTAMHVSFQIMAFVFVYIIRTPPALL